MCRLSILVFRFRLLPPLATALSATVRAERKQQLVLSSVAFVTDARVALSKQAGGKRRWHNTSWGRGVVSANGSAGQGGVGLRSVEQGRDAGMQEGIGIVSEIGDRLAAVGSKINAACAEIDRDPSEVELIAVSKTFDADAIRPVLEAGQRHFGENRVQEAQGKWPELRAGVSDVVLHLIGPLQSNKAKEAVALFDAIHSVDRPKIAKAIADETARQGRTLELFIQVNTGEEPQKAGIAPTELPDFIAYCRTECGLEVSGLMCIPPVDDAPAPHFALLKKLAARHELAKLSMGMSADYGNGGPIRSQLCPCRVCDFWLQGIASRQR